MREPVKRRREPGTPVRSWAACCAGHSAAVPSATAPKRSACLRPRTSRTRSRLARASMWMAMASVSAKPVTMCQLSKLNPARYRSPPATHHTPEPPASATTSKASRPSAVRRSQRRGRSSRGQTRRSLPHSRSSSQRPAAPWNAKTSHSSGRPLKRLSSPDVKAAVPASARLQSVTRGDTRFASPPRRARRHAHSAWRWPRMHRWQHAQVVAHRRAVCPLSRVGIFKREKGQRCRVDQVKPLTCAGQRSACRALACWQRPSSVPRARTAV